MTVVAAAALAHRAIAAASVLGLRKVAHGLRVTVAEMAAACGSASASADMVVMTDEGHLAERELHAVMARVRAAIGDQGVVALVVGSPVTRALVTTAREDVILAMGGRDDAYARAIAWAGARAEHVAHAPSLDPHRLGAIVEATAACDLTLVEPELAAASPALARVRGMRSPRARALLATVALGAAARPLLFVPSRVAPRGGLARTRVERVADGWVEAMARTPDGSGEGRAPDVVRAALAVLRDSARAGEGPMSVRELLRQARERWSSEARAAGARATPSASDARDLAASLHQLSASEDVTLFALDPADPGWALTIL